MPPIKHNVDHPNRPEWWNGISLGNALTIAVLCVGAAVAWGANGQKQDEQDKRIDELRVEIAAVEARNEKRIDELRGDMKVLNSSITELITAIRRSERN